MSHPFKVSDKVICINDKDLVICKPIIYGQMYVVNSVRMCSLTGRPVTYLAGIENVTHPRTGNEMGYKARRFRKLDDIKEENRLKCEQGVSK